MAKVRPTGVDYRLVGFALLRVWFQAEVLPQRVIAAEVFAFDGNLGRLVVAVFLSISNVGVLAFEIMILDLMAIALE